MTVKQLTDEQVADLADPSLDEIWGCEDVNTLAREVQEYRALRPPCPTCDGKQWWRHVAQSAEGIEGDYVDPCPDCTDGKMPFDKWVALLVETLRRRNGRQCPLSGHWYPYTNQTEADRPVAFVDPRIRSVDCADDQCQNPTHRKYVRCAHVWHDADALLKMAHRNDSTDTLIPMNDEVVS